MVRLRFSTEACCDAFAGDKFCPPTPIRPTPPIVTTPAPSGPLRMYPACRPSSLSIEQLRLISVPLFVSAHSCRCRGSFRKVHDHTALVCTVNPGTGAAVASDPLLQPADRN